MQQYCKLKWLTYCLINDRKCKSLVFSIELLKNIPMLGGIWTRDLNSAAWAYLIDHRWSLYQWATMPVMNYWQICHFILIIQLSIKKNNIDIGRTWTRVLTSAVWTYQWATMPVMNYWQMYHFILIIQLSIQKTILTLAGLEPGSLILQDELIPMSYHACYELLTNVSLYINNPALYSKNNIDIGRT